MKKRVKFRHPETGETVSASESAAAKILADAGAGGKDLTGLTKAELLEYAKANGVEVDAKANKADLLAAIEAE